MPPLPPSTARLVHSSGEIRIVARGDMRYIERAEKDALSEVRWVQVGSAIDIKGGPTMAGPMGDQARYALRLLDDLADTRDELMRTYVYKKA